MHESSMIAMKLIENFISSFGLERELKVVDIGALDINGCYKGIFSYRYKYTGYDLTEGKNVDVVGKDKYKFPFPDSSFDILISGQTLEHVEDIFSWVREAARVIKPTGMIALIAPNSWKEHRFPVDCWRIFPDGMRFLIEGIAKMEIIKVKARGRDTIGIGRKLRWDSNKSLLG